MGRARSWERPPGVRGRRAQGACGGGSGHLGQGATRRVRRIWLHGGHGAPFQKVMGGGEACGGDWGKGAWERCVGARGEGAGGEQG